MRPRDLLGFVGSSLRAHLLRSLLSMIGIAVGIAAVILLTSLGEGTRRYIVGQFAQFGTNFLKINPGSTETAGLPGVFGGSTRKLTIDDGEALLRLDGVRKVVPTVFAQARVEAGERGRSVVIFGTTSDAAELWAQRVSQGSFLPAGDPRRGGSEAVLGAKLKAELFGEENALGQHVRIGGWRLRVVGVMESKGQMLGFDIDDVAYVPVTTALRMFNLDELQEIDVSFVHEGLTDSVVAGIKRVLGSRHGGEDFTILTQAAMLEVFDNVINVVTLAVGAIAGISLLVGAIGILTMMWIAVGERTAEIGLLKAIGATSGQVQAAFLLEAVGLAVAGGALGLGAGMGLGALARAIVPGLPFSTPPLYVGLALALCVATGLVSGVAPARRAAQLDPVEALRAD
jgi:putative ABC transport system permease protein